jgi:SAM-dependent methyltransferase
LLRRRARVLLDLAARGASVGSLLEIGPGFGFVADEARQRGWRYAGVEANDRGAAALRERGYDIHLGAVPPLPSVHRPVDLVLASHVLEHLDSGDTVLELLGAIRAALAPGGRLCVACPDAMAHPRQFWNVDYTHRWPTTPRRLRQVLIDARYRVVLETPLRATLTGVRSALVTPLAWMPLPPGRLGQMHERAYRARLFFLREIVVVAESG